MFDCLGLQELSSFDARQALTAVNAPPRDHDYAAARGGGDGGGCGGGGAGIDALRAAFPDGLWIDSVTCLELFCTIGFMQNNLIHFFKYDGLHASCVYYEWCKSF